MDTFKEIEAFFSQGFLHFLNVFSLIAIFDSTRRIFQKKFSKLAFILLIIGTVYSLGLAGYSFFMSNLLVDLEKPRLESLQNAMPLPDDFAIDLPVAERAKRTQNIAEIYFKEFGEYSRIINLEGHWQPFVPSPQDIKAREEKVAQAVDLMHVIRKHELTVKYWLISFFVSIFLGWVAAHHKYRSQLWFSS
jgi:hypothetical protein